MTSHNGQARRRSRNPLRAALADRRHTGGRRRRRRRLTLRLERLQHSVEAWGDGALSTRVAVEGQDEVARLAASFNHSAARIESLVDAQKSLLANARMNCARRWRASAWQPN